MIAIILFTILCLLIGAAVLFWLQTPINAGELLTIPLIGLGVLGMSCFYLSFCGLPIRWWTLTTLAVLATIALSAFGIRVRRGGVRLPVLKRPGKEALLLLPGLCALGVIGYTAFVYRLQAWDSFAVWGIKAKALYAEGLWSSACFSDPRLAFSHLDYPLLFPAQLGAMHALTGGPETFFCKYVCVFTFLAGLLYFAHSACSRLPKSCALLLAGAVFALPTLIDQAGTGYADVTLFVFYLAVVHQLTAEKEGDPFLSAILVTILAMTKNEGLALAAMAAALIVVRHLWAGEKRSAVRFATSAGLMLVPLFVWKLTVPDLHEQYLSRILSGDFRNGLYGLGLITRIAWIDVKQLSAWGAGWTLLPLAAAFLLWCRRDLSSVRKRLILLSCLLATQVGLYVTVYLSSPTALHDLLPVTVWRLSLHCFPPVLYIWMTVGQGLNRAVDPKKDINTVPSTSPCALSPQTETPE